MNTIIDFLVIGGGAAGFFGAIQYKTIAPHSRVVIIEKTATLLSKVRISGGGRCNVTHAQFDPDKLVENYPRGKQELRGPFHTFQPKNMVEWLSSRGVVLKIEEDGRMFPTTDSSETIIQCFLQEAAKLGIEVYTQQHITSVVKEGDLFIIEGLSSFFPCKAKSILLATGSGKDGHQIARVLGHTTTTLVPSLFTFNCHAFPLSEASGISTLARISIKDANLSQQGPLLITHFGFSGPAALKLSAFAARFCSDKAYQFALEVNWAPLYEKQQLEKRIVEWKESAPKKLVETEPPIDIPKRLWKLLSLPFHEKTRNALSKKDLMLIVEVLSSSKYQVEGKTTNKEEFVTCGGVCNREVNWKNMESKLVSGLFFAGEVLDVDGVTGGFNFQNAWTTSTLAAYGAAKKSH